MSGDKHHKKKTSFASMLWSESILKFIANATVLFLVVCLVKLLIITYKIIVLHSQSRVAHFLSGFSFDSYKIPDLLNLILSIWIMVSLVAIAIDYFIVYPIQCGRTNKRTANGT